MTPALRAAWLWLTDAARVDENLEATRARIESDPDWQAIRARALLGDETALDALIAGVAMTAHAAMLAGVNGIVDLERALEEEPTGTAGGQGPRRRRKRR